MSEALAALCRHRSNILVRVWNWRADRSQLPHALRL